MPIDELANATGFYSVDAMISSAIDEIATGLFKQELQQQELRLSQSGQILAGRVKLRMLVDQFKLSAEILSLIHI